MNNKKNTCNQKTQESKASPKKRCQDGVLKQDMKDGRKKGEPCLDAMDLINEN